MAVNSPEEVNGFSPLSIKEESEPDDPIDNIQSTSHHSETVFAIEKFEEVHFIDSDLMQVEKFEEVQESDNPTDIDGENLETHDSDRNLYLTITRNSVKEIYPRRSTIDGSSLNQNLTNRPTTSNLEIEESNGLSNDHSAYSRPIRRKSVNKSKTNRPMQIESDDPIVIGGENIESLDSDRNQINPDTLDGSSRNQHLTVSPTTINLESDECNGGEQSTNSIRRKSLEKTTNTKNSTIIKAELSDEKYLDSLIDAAEVYDAPLELNEMLYRPTPRPNNSHVRPIILARDFGKLPLKKKIEIKNNGRPTPALYITQIGKGGKNRPYNRKFSHEYYNKFKWLGGCSKKNRLFCFPCVLFGGDAAWARVGVNDLANLSKLCVKHESSRKHKENSLNLGFLGRTPLAERSDTTIGDSIRRNNEEVTKNRLILSQIINCVKFCGHYELPLGGRDENVCSNPGLLRGLLDRITQMDGSLKYHFEKSALFKGNLEAIKNEIIDCMLHVCQDNIAREISEANFLSVCVDDVTDVSEQVQIVVIYRYEVLGQPVERFWTFKNSTRYLYSSICEELTKVLPNRLQKLIAQTYDGAAAMAGGYGGVHKLIKEKYPNAHFVHNYAHELDLIVRQAAQTTKEARIFFSSSFGISHFFSESPQRLAILERVSADAGGERIPSNIHWTVNFVKDNIENLRKCFEIFSESSALATRCEALGLLRLLNDSEFLHWLNFFSLLMPHVDILRSQRRSKNTDSAHVAKALESFLKKVEEVIDQIEDDSSGSENPSKRKRSELNKKAEYEICETIIKQMSERFTITTYLEANSLVSKENFGKFQVDFPLDIFKKTVEAYPSLNASTLITELGLLYNFDELHNFRSTCELLQFLKENEEFSALGEVIKLLEIVITTPMISSEEERTFSTLKRVKTFLKNAVAEEGLTALAMLSCEREMIASIPSFNDQVVEKFSALKDHRSHLTFK